MLTVVAELSKDKEAIRVVVEQPSYQCVLLPNSVLSLLCLS